jgi:single-strand DNA-binding protein
MNLRNRVHLIGNLGNDPEVKKTENGKTLAKFSLATNDYYNNQEGEKVKDTQWHNIVVWGRSVDFVEKYLKKGHEIALEGKLNHRSYEDKNGQKKYFTEVVVNEILLLKARESEEKADLPF